MRIGLAHVVLALLTAAAAAFIALPCFALLLKVPGGALLKALGEPAVAEALLLTAKTSFAAMVACVVLGTPAAYVLARSDFRGKQIAEALLNLPLVLPPVVAGVALLMASAGGVCWAAPSKPSAWRYLSTTWRWSSPRPSCRCPFTCRPPRAGFQSVPGQLEAGLADAGRQRLGTFLRITLPLSWPAVASGAVLCWGSGRRGVRGQPSCSRATSPVRRATMPLAILTAMQRDFDEAAVLALLLLVFSAVMFASAHWLLPRTGACGMIQVALTKALT